MQRFNVITLLYQSFGNILRIRFSAGKNNSVNTRVKIDKPL